MGNESKTLTDDEMERMAGVLIASGFMEQIAKKQKQVQQLMKQMQKIIRFRQTTTAR